ncbi:hypothetical protein FA15DRAFT_739131 [Coprinopsis marcescibilis]|uniref:Dipeptidyl-peptidase V n=1 Tax=Coprinopsis marcescibilis TaxID=230819 RepID=A0A5C3KXE0_COPMA|nr:hypothetical protein FA15DRAFT_739131 [Coprinopsis marcescibilis]
MKLSIPLLGLSGQVPFSLNSAGLRSPASPQANMAVNDAFALKGGNDTFSPRDLVGLGRPGSAVANYIGDLALVPFSKYSFEDKKNYKSIFIVSLDNGDIKPLQISLEKGGDTFWLADRTIANVADGELYALDIVFDGAEVSLQAGGFKPQLVGKFPTTTSTNFRYNVESSLLVFSDYVYEDGNLSTVKQQDDEWEARGTTAYVYDTTYERHWDEWQGPKRPQLFSVSLSSKENNWKLGDEFNSPLRGTKHYSPVEPFGGLDDFDISSTHILYTAKDPELPYAWHTKQNVYIVQIEGDSKPKELTSGRQGAIHSPVFNTAGTKAAWLELDKDGYESDRAKIVIYDLEKEVRFTVTQGWDRSPDSLTFSKDDTFIYLTAGDEAKVKVFALPVAPTPSQSTTHPRLDAKYSIPVSLTSKRASSDVQVLPNGRLLFSQSSFTSPKNAFIISDLPSIQSAILEGNSDALSGLTPTRLTDFVKEELEGKYLDEGEEFWFKGAHHRDIQGWALKPKGWTPDEAKKWPVVLLIHGGPQGAWEDQWSTRWNPNVFANQGYFVIMINPTGSTTFGQEFTDAIAEDWGGKPFLDMINGWKHALQKYPEIDADRAVAAGASWGGYAINWIQGHPEFGFDFKALIAHDGVFDSTYNGYSTDELYFFNHEWGGRPWESKSKKLSEKMSPSNYVHKWSTPQLLIHGSKDYRLPETESIGAFHALQQLGIPSRLVIFPDENHWVLSHGNSLKWHYEVFRWFAQFV